MPGFSAQQVARHEALRDPSATLKRQVVDEAVRTVGGRSLVDLGGAWAVDGHYTFHALDTHQLDHAVLVDAWPTPALTEAAADYPALTVLQASLGDPAVPEQVGPVDVTLLFDILLHQVSPDWDDILAMYAPTTRALGIVNPQWRGETTVRLLDLGVDRYRQVVPQTRNLEPTLARLGEWHDGYNRPVRDIFEVWQWGITGADLDATMTRLGFTRTFHRDIGSWYGLADFDNVGAVYARA